MSQPTIILRNSIVLEGTAVEALHDYLGYGPTVCTKAFFQNYYRCLDRHHLLIPKMYFRSFEAVAPECITTERANMLS